MPSKTNEAEFLPRKFEKIKSMYLSDKIVARNKRFSILNWLLDQIGKYQNDVSSLTYELLWKTLHEILEIERSNSEGQILIKSSAISNLLLAVENYPFQCPWASTILTSVSIFLQIPAVNSTLISDVDKLTSLLILTVKTLCRLNHNRDDQSLKEAKDLLNIVLDILETLPSSNGPEKASLFADHMQDLAVFMHIADDSKDLEELSTKLAKKIIFVIFNLKKKDFESLLTSPVNLNEELLPNSHLLHFFKSLQKNLTNENVVFNSVSVSECCAVLMKKLLSVFLMENKCSLKSLKIASLFFAVAGLDIPIVFSAKSCCHSVLKGEEEHSDVQMFGISKLLESCQYFNVNMSVPAEYLNPLLWFQGISATLLTMKVSKNKSSWLKCFYSLIKISPSIFEQDIMYLIKIAFLNISVKSKESRKHYCELFDVVLQAHSKLHQVPKFFVKLLLALTECIKDNSGGNLLSNGQILPQVEESLAKCVQELPHGQMIELWKIFIETFSTLENMSQVFMISKGFMFFVAQLFSIFLLHAQLFQVNVPSNICSQFLPLIEKTCVEVQKIVKTLMETDSRFVPSQRSVLLLSYAIGEVKLAYIAFYGKSLEHMSEDLLPEEPFDFSILHNYFDKNHGRVIENLINSEDKVLSSLVFQLLLQKVKAFQFKESLSQIETGNVQKCISTILKYLQESCPASASWDVDICSVNCENYGTAYWLMFFKVSPLMLNYFSPRDFYEFCTAAQSVILQDGSSENGAKSIILAACKSGFFQESKHFQTAFISAVWKQENLITSKKRSFDEIEAGQSPIDTIFSVLSAYHSKALKYAERTPKSNKNLGSMWTEIKEISDLLNNILLSESLPKGKLVTSKIKDLLKLLKCLPLEYLLPGNQMKCIIGLSLLFFLVPQSCEPDEMVTLARDISQLLLCIFEGVRSIWLFDFVSSGPYLKYVVKTMESVMTVQMNEEYHWIIQFIDHLVNLIVKNVGSLVPAEPYIAELADKKHISRADLITFHAFLKKILQVLVRPHKQGPYQETLAKISSATIQAFMKQLKSNFTGDTDNWDQSYFMKCYMEVIEIVYGSAETEKLGKKCFKMFPMILEKAVKEVESSNISCSDLYLLFISKVCKHFDKLSSFLPENFASTACKIVLSHVEQKMRKEMESFPSNRSLKDSCSEICKLCSFNSEETRVEEGGMKPDARHDGSEMLPFCLNELEDNSLKEILLRTPLEDIVQNFKSITQKMFAGDTKTVGFYFMQMCMLLFKSVIEGGSDKCQSFPFKEILCEFMSNLIVIANQACDSVICQTMVKIPVLDFVDFVIKGNKGLPKHVLLQSLHCVAPVSLKVIDNNYRLFIKSFNAVWSVVYDLFMHHKSTILPIPAAFLLCVAKLLKSIVLAGEIGSLSQCDADTVQQVQLSAQNMNRLLTVITRHKTEFSKLVPYLVSDYVDTVQHITIDSSIKECILSGIYRVLDISSEDSIKMQARNINSISSEVFENLVKNYRKNKCKPS